MKKPEKVQYGKSGFSHREFDSLQVTLRKWRLDISVAPNNSLKHIVHFDFILRLNFLLFCHSVRVIWLDIPT